MKSTFDNWYEKKMRATPVISAETDRAEELLDRIDTIAIVGISRNRHRDSHYVGRYLKNAGYSIIPVNPGADEILGEKAYPDLKSISETIDAVDVFRPSDVIPEVVTQALEVDTKAIWLQPGTGTHDELKKIVEKKGTYFFQSRCIKVDHQFLVRPKKKQQEKTVSKT